MMRSSSSGLVVNEAAVASPIAQAHQASGCRSRGRAVDPVTSGQTPRRRRATTALPAIAITSSPTTPQVTAAGTRAGCPPAGRSPRRTRWTLSRWETQRRSRTGRPRRWWVSRWATHRRRSPSRTPCRSPCRTPCRPSSRPRPDRHCAVSLLQTHRPSGTRRESRTRRAPRTSMGSTGSTGWATASSRHRCRHRFRRPPRRRPCRRHPWIRLVGLELGEGVGRGARRLGRGRARRGRGGIDRRRDRGRYAAARGSVLLPGPADRAAGGHHQAAHAGGRVRPRRTTCRRTTTGPSRRWSATCSRTGRSRARRSPGTRTRAAAWRRRCRRRRRRRPPRRSCRRRRASRP